MRNMSFKRRAFSEDLYEDTMPPSGSPKLQAFVDDAVQEFLEKGGKIKQCPPCVHSEGIGAEADAILLWKLENGQRMQHPEKKRAEMLRDIRTIVEAIETGDKTHILETFIKLDRSTATWAKWAKHHVAVESALRQIGFKFSSHGWLNIFGTHMRITELQKGWRPTWATK